MALTRFAVRTSVRALALLLALAWTHPLLAEEVRTTGVDSGDPAQPGQSASATATANDPQNSATAIGGRGGNLGGSATARAVNTGPNAQRAEAAAVGGAGGSATNTRGGGGDADASVELTGGAAATRGVASARGEGFADRPGRPMAAMPAPTPVWSAKDPRSKA
jgi:hypothetical protein